jgi:hypothetical protein
VNDCYPQWIQQRNSAKFYKLQQIEEELDDIEHRRIAAHHDFENELEIRQHLSNKVIPRFSVVNTVETKAIACKRTGKERICFPRFTASTTSI